MTTDAIALIIAKAVESIPEWLRQDLLSKDPVARQRAEETLAAMIVAALRK